MTTVRTVHSIEILITCSVLSATPYSGLGMSFFQRVANLLFHWNIIIARYIQRNWLFETLERSNLSEVIKATSQQRHREKSKFCHNPLIVQVDLIKSEAQRIIYAGRSEFLFEVVRPINNRVKHFASNIQMLASNLLTEIKE